MDSNCIVVDDALPRLESWITYAQSSGGTITWWAALVEIPEEWDQETTMEELQEIYDAADLITTPFFGFPILNPLHFAETFYTHGFFNNTLADVPYSGIIYKVNNGTDYYVAFCRITPGILVPNGTWNFKTVLTLESKYNTTP